MDVVTIAWGRELIFPPQLSPNNNAGMSDMTKHVWHQDRYMPNTGALLTLFY